MTKFCNHNTKSILMCWLIISGLLQVPRQCTSKPMDPIAPPKIAGSIADYTTGGIAFNKLAMSPFAPLVYIAEELTPGVEIGTALYTIDQKRIPGLLVDWDPTTGEPYTISQKALYLGGEKKTDIPSNYEPAFCRVDALGCLRIVAVGAGGCATFDGKVWQTYKLDCDDGNPDNKLLQKHGNESHLGEVTYNMAISPAGDEIAYIRHILIREGFQEYRSRIYYIDDKGVLHKFDSPGPVSGHIFTPAGLAWSCESSASGIQNVYLNEKVICARASVEFAGPLIGYRTDDGRKVVGGDGKIYGLEYKSIDGPYHVGGRAAFRQRYWPIRDSLDGGWAASAQDIAGRTFLLIGGNAEPVSANVFEGMRNPMVTLREGAKPLFLRHGAVQSEIRAVDNPSVKCLAQFDQPVTVISIDRRGRRMLVQSIATATYYYLDLTTDYSERINLPRDWQLNECDWNLDGTLFLKTNKTSTYKFQMITIKEVF